ncbi:MAG: glutamate racemase, partial [Myxococcota bacterium]
LVSSAEETAKDVYAMLLDHDLQGGDTSSPGHEFLATGDPSEFGRVASVFLGPELTDVGAAQAQPVGGGSWN